MTFDDLSYTIHDGERADQDVVLYSLSTCVHCAEAISLLQMHRIRFRYTFLDELEPELKKRIKKELRIHFHTPLSFPFLVVDGQMVSVGYNKAAWEQRLGL